MRRILYLLLLPPMTILMIVTWAMTAVVVYGDRAVDRLVRRR